MSRTVDFAIIGGGPAGLSAAITAAREGLSVEVLDEQSTPCGQIYRAVESVRDANIWKRDLLGADYMAGANLVSEFRKCSATYRPNCKVWGLSSEGEINLVGPYGAEDIQAKRVLIAAGAMERPMPIPGWTLPGVMSAGSAQIQMKTAGQVPDVPFVIAGSGPLLYLVAWQLIKAAAPLLAVLDTTPKANYLRAARHGLGALKNFGQIRKGLAWIRDIKRTGVQVLSRINDLRIEGERGVKAIQWQRANGQSGTIRCNMVLLHQGVVPNYHLASVAGCSVRWNTLQKCWQTKKDDWGATGVETIAVAGDCSVIGGAIAARHQGNLAGLDTLFRLGAISSANKAQRATASLNALKSQSGLRKFLDELYAPPPWVTIPADETIVCRCEEVRGKDVRTAAEQGAVGANQLKFYTRAGMGRCQGRMCGLTCSAICADVHGSRIEDVGFARVRPPIRPVTIGDLAGIG